MHPTGGAGLGDANMESSVREAALLEARLDKMEALLTQVLAKL